DGRDLDRVRAAVDGFFEADDRHGQRPIVVAVRATTSEGTYESASAAAAHSEGRHLHTSRPQAFHDPSTGFPQLDGHDAADYARRVRPVPVHMSITPRQTRLLRVQDLRTYQQTIADLALAGDVRAIRRRAVIVPSGAAGRQLRRTLDATLGGRGGAAVLPHIVTRDGWYALMHGAMTGVPAMADGFEREVMLYAAARDARDAGAVPPFTIRAGIVAEMLRFYDELRRRDCDLLKFQRRIDDELSKDVDDRG